jgi:ABC-type multidrug transport system fused ATPase/permease subunit
MKTLLEIWRLLNPAQRRHLLMLQFVSLAMAFATLCGIAAVLPFIGALGETLSGSGEASSSWLHEYFVFGSDRTSAAALGIAFVVLVMLANLVNLAGSLAMTRFAFAVGNQIHVTLFNEYLHRDCHFHARTNSAKLASKVIHEAGRVTTGLLHSALTLMTSLATSALIVGSLVVLNPLVAFFAVAALGASYLLIFKVAHGRLLQNGRVQSAQAEERIKIVNESFGGIREILLANRQDVFVERFRRSCNALARTVLTTLAIAQSPKYILECLAVATLVGIALLLAKPAAGSADWIAQLTFVGFAAYRLLPALQNVFSASVKITADSPAFHNIAEELRSARARALTADVGHIDRTWAARPQHEITLTSVCFRYAPDQPCAIHDVSLRIPARTTVGVVGANGAGKTTLLDIIAGLLTPQTGAVAVDSIVLGEHNRGAWRSGLAYVPQDVFILDATLAENIALGVPPAAIDWNAMRNATRMAQLEECIAGLPNGYAEMLGERGARLSGGQRQRIGLARALYRDAAVLILDEGTSALDAQAERDVIDALARFRHQRTVFIITHGANLLRQCDLVVELDQGRIVRTSTPAEVVPPVARVRSPPTGHTAGHALNQ